MDLTLTPEEIDLILSRRKHELELEQSKKLESDAIAKEQKQVEELLHILELAEEDQSNIVDQIDSLEKYMQDVCDQIIKIRHKLRKTCTHAQPLTQDGFKEDHCPGTYSDWTMVCPLCRCEIEIGVMGTPNAMLAVDQQTRRVFRTVTRD